MCNRVITLCYRKIIAHNPRTAWEKMVFEDSHEEYRMQVQRFDPDGRCTRFSELVRQVPESRQLHFLVSTSVANYLKQLQDLVPDVLDNLGRRFLHFKTYRFEIIDSAIHDPRIHRVSISFISEPLWWLDTIGEYVLLAEPSDATTGPLPTKLFKLPPYVSINFIQYPKCDD